MLVIIIIIIIIIIILDEMAVNLRGWLPQIRETHKVCNLQLHHDIFGGENLASCLAG